ncbi:hypothetical protein HK101_004038 [Irineochytrium annulatum]|nr:hypothetical protein HK101_004038 [Irineochytrium annulatum]
MLLTLLCTLAVVCDLVAGAPWVHRRKQALVIADDNGVPNSIPSVAHGLDLFGNTVPWHLDRWETVDDRSQSYLSAIDSSSPDSGVLFHGLLDTSTLGGAGFASQSISLLPNETALFVSTSTSAGLILDVIASESFTYALNLRTADRKRRPDGRVESTVEYKCLFKVERKEGEEVVRCGWGQFEPYYRGRKVVDGSAPELRLGEVKGISIMAQSLFDKQKGPFKLRIRSIGVAELD